MLKRIQDHLQTDQRSQFLTYPIAEQIYADCVDVDKREEIGVRPILNILRSMNR